MKQKISLIFVIVLVSSQLTNAVDPIDPIRETPTSITAFDEGSLQFGLYRPLELELGSYKNDGEKGNNFRNINIRGQGTYFFKKGLGAGVTIDLNSDKDKDDENDNSSTYSNNTMSFHIIYGTQVNNINVYVQPHAGFGRYLSEYEYGSFSSEYKEKIFKAGIKGGVLLSIGEGTNTYFSPQIGWDYIKYTDKDNSTDFTSTSDFFIGGMIAVVIPTQNIPCDIGTNFENVSSRFTEGRNIFEYTNRLDLSFLGYKEEYEDGGQTYEDKDKETDFSLNLSYRRGIADRLFVGGFINTDFENYDWDEDPDYTQTYTNFLIGPVVEYHPIQEVKLENFFVDAMLGFGGSKNKTKEGTTTNESKNSRLTFDLAAGYDFGITNNISLVPRAGFEYGHSKNKDSDVKYSTSNFFISISTRINVTGP